MIIKQWIAELPDYYCGNLYLAFQRRKEKRQTFRAFWVIYSETETLYWVLWFLENQSEWKSLGRVRLFLTPWAIQSMAFSRPEYYSGQPFPSSGDLPNPGLLHYRQILFQLSHQGSPRILEWVACHSPADIANPGIKLGSPAL